jgi:hypothetical protein
MLEEWMGKKTEYKETEDKKSVERQRLEYWNGERMEEGKNQKSAYRSQYTE